MSGTECYGKADAHDPHTPAATFSLEICILMLDAERCCLPGEDQIRYKDPVPRGVLKEPIAGTAVVDEDHHQNADSEWPK